jgi:hypothetical protein
MLLRFVIFLIVTYSGGGGLFARACVRVVRCFASAQNDEPRIAAAPVSCGAWPDKAPAEVPPTGKMMRSSKHASRLAEVVGGGLRRSGRASNRTAAPVVVDGGGLLRREAQKNLAMPIGPGSHC